MRILLPLVLLLFACQSTPKAATPEDLQAALEARSLEAATAVAFADLETALAVSSQDARAFFEAQQRLFEMMGDGDVEVGQIDDAGIEFVSASHDGARGTGILVADDMGEQVDFVLHFVLEDGEWKLDGFSETLDSEPQRLVHLVGMIEEQIAFFEEEILPHPDFGPVVEAYLEAIATADAEAMQACMTPECWQDQQRATSWSRSYLSGEITLVEWAYGPKSDDDQEASIELHVTVQSSDGERDQDVMRFRGASVDGAWKITELN